MGEISEYHFQLEPIGANLWFTCTFYWGFARPAGRLCVQ